MEDPQVWWRRLVDAVIALRLGQREVVIDYLRWVENLRGRPVAEAARDNLKRLATAEKWGDVHLWPSWGYQCKPPKIERDERPTSRKRRS